MHFVQHGLREFLTRPRDYSPVVARHLLFDPDGLLATAAFMGSNYLGGAVFSVGVRRRRRLSQIAGVGSLVHR